MEDEQGKTKDKIIPGFKTVKEATERVLGELGSGYQKSSWRRKNKHEEARERLQDEDWTLAQAIIREEYEKSERVLETGRINLALLHPKERISSSAPIVRTAMFYGILLGLVNQRVELTSDVSNQKKIENTLEEVGVAVATREYQKDLSRFSVPQLLKELSSLADGVLG